MGPKKIHKREFNMKSTYTTKKRKWLMQIEWKCCDKLHPNVTFPQDSQVGIPKLLSKGMWYPKTTFKGNVVGNQVPNLTPTPSFDHNSCKPCLNEHCEGT
jgi:hypothetical protein